MKKTKDQTTEARILDAARKVFISKGMAGARMQDIADEAGINKALLHYYYSNKEKLFEMIFMEAAQLLFPKITIIFESDIPLFEKIEKFADEYISVIIKNPYLPLFILNEIHQDRKAFWKKMKSGSGLPKPDKFLKQIDDEIKKGTIKQIDPLQLLLNLLSLSIFPFMAQPVFQLHLGINDAEFKTLIEERRKEIPRFIIDAIRK